MKNDKNSKTKSSSQSYHDSPSRMDRPIAGNPDQRRNQVHSIARSVMDDTERAEPSPDPDAMEDGNHQPEIAHSSITHHTHTVHDHQSGESKTHKVPHGHDCPECGTEYMATGAGDNR